MARRATTRPERPQDPRARAVVAATEAPANIIVLDLECGHSIRRKRGLCMPKSSRVICGLCPSQGGDARV